MKTFFRFWSAVWIICLFAPALPAEPDSASMLERFYEANKAYRDGLYEQAVDGYRRLIDDGYTSGHIYYNLGNSHFRMGALGHAILAYERARQLIPRDDDLLFNLSYARSQTIDALDEDGSSTANGFLGIGSLNMREVFYIFSAVNMSFFCVLALRLFVKSEWSYYLTILLAILITIGAGAFLLKWYDWRTDDRAVVLADEVAVRAGPDPTDTVLFNIHEGTVVHYERSEDDWVLLNLSKEQRGWAPAKVIEPIIPR